jgi:endonuclease/exonuclease/phosphatase family metal-dependent hydrolase
MLVLIPNQLLSQEMTVMTYNIKYDNTKDTVNNWNDRKEAIARLIQHYSPQIFGTQEALYHQTVYLDSSLTSYSYIGVGRDDGKQRGEYSAIHYDRTTLEVLETNTFWLSETPEKISVGWDAAMERICTYALFQHLLTGKKFYVFNTHFDHIGKTARAKSAELIVKKIEAINTKKLPVVLMGDFNLTPDEAPIAYLMKKLIDGRQESIKAPFGPTGTFSGFDREMTLDKRIDYIFVKEFMVKSYVHIDDRMENNKHLSDHFPVFATIKF